MNLLTRQSPEAGQVPGWVPSRARTPSEILAGVFVAHAVDEKSPGLSGVISAEI